MMHGEAPPPALRHEEPSGVLASNAKVEAVDTAPVFANAAPIAQEATRRSHGSKGYISVLTLAAFFGILAFIVPWFTIRSSVGSWSYSPVRNMFTAYVGILDEIGGAWFILLMVLALVAYWTRTPAVCALGMVAMIPTLLVLAIFSAGCFFVPSLIPQSWVPTRFHHYIPQVAGGLGVLLSLVSSSVLLIWFVVLFAHSLRLRRHVRPEMQTA